MQKERGYSDSFRESRKASVMKKAITQPSTSYTREMLTLRTFLLLLFINETVLMIYKPNKAVMTSHYKSSSDTAVNTTFILEDNTHI